MSRNLGQTSCARCGKEGVIKIVENPRPITAEEAGDAFAKYEGMLVAHAACWVCGAKYIGWCDERTMARPPTRYVAGVSIARYAEPVAPYTLGGYFDLSYRSTFDIRPGADDLPGYDEDAVEPLVTRALFLIERAMKRAREDPDLRVRTVQMNNLRAAQYELLGAWDCRNDHPRHGPAVARSKTIKYGGAGASVDVTYMTHGQLYITERDRGETQWWNIPLGEIPDQAVREVGRFVLRVLKAKLDTLREEGRLY